MHLLRRPKTQQKSSCIRVKKILIEIKKVYNVRKILGIPNINIVFCIKVPGTNFSNQIYLVLC